MPSKGFEGSSGPSSEPADGETAQALGALAVGADRGRATPGHRETEWSVARRNREPCSRESARSPGAGAGDREVSRCAICREGPPA